MFKEYAREEGPIAQGFGHRATLADDCGEVVFSGHAIAERRAQAMATETFALCGSALSRQSCQKGDHKEWNKKQCESPN